MNQPTHGQRPRALRKAVVVLALIGLALNLLASPAFAHRNGCHRWHSCPSDTGSYVCGDTGYYTYCGYGPITQTAPRPVTPTAPPTLATIPAPAATLRPSKPPPLVLPALIFPTAALSTTSGWHSKWLSQSEYVALTPGQVAAFWIRFLNVGTETWTRGVLGQQVNLALNGDDRAPFRLGMASRWLWEDRLATTATDQTKPGEIAEFRFEIKAPMTAGRYSLSLRPVVEGITWLEDEGVFWIIDVSGQPTAPAPSSKTFS
jgi:hypothetical protein